MTKLKILALVLLGLSSCQEFVEIAPPKTEISASAVYNSDENVNAILTGVYARMSNNGFASGYVNSVTYLTSFSADVNQYLSTNSNQSAFHSNSLLPANSNVAELWSSMYEIIYTTNDILKNLQQSDNVSAATKQQVTGEAKFIRAFCYFYLYNLWGEVPLTTSTDYRSNAKAPRNSKEEVTQLIVADLTNAIQLLPEDYLLSNGEKIRPNKWAAAALLSRVYLYEQDWQNAEATATDVIANGGFLLTPLEDVFLKNSEEAIWQLMPVNNGYNTWEGFLFILTGFPSSALSTELMNNFETNDQRKMNWVAQYTQGTQMYNYPFKYKVKSDFTITEYSMMLRLAEQYLIRAEARVHLNNLAAAKVDLDLIRTRAGLPNTNASTNLELLMAIENERWKELFSEWGHRWLDLKRTGRIDQVMQSAKGTAWQATDALFPIPQKDISNNPNLDQNPGY